MTAVPYKKYFLISRPRFDTASRRWFPYVSVVWNAVDYGDPEGGFPYHVFREHDQTFNTEEEALVFGFTFVRARVDGNLRGVKQTE